MKIIIKTLLLTMLLGGILWSCRKGLPNYETQASVTNLQYTQQFFKTKGNLTPEVQKVYEYLRNENNKKEFVPQFVVKYGVPVWDKSIIQKNNYNVETTNLPTYVIVPLIDYTEKKVVGFLGSKVTNEAVITKLFRSNIYDELGFADDPNKFDGNDMQRLMMKFEHDIFGHYIFKITDNRLIDYVPDTTPDKTNSLIIKANTQAVTERNSIQLNPFGFYDPGNPPEGCVYVAMFYASYNTPFIHIQISSWELKCNTAITIATYFEPAESGAGIGGLGSGGGGGNSSDPNDPQDDPPPPPPNEPCPETIGVITIVEPCGTGDDGWDLLDEDELEYRCIIDSLTGYPCAQNILNQLPKLNIEARKIMDSVFGVNDDYNLEFNIDSTLDKNSEDGYATTGIRRGPSLQNLQISLNPWVLTNASKEYIAVTFFHECVHAYIDHNRYLLAMNYIDSSTFIQRFPLFWDYKRRLSSAELVQHTIMANNYISHFKNLIINFNPSVTDSIANALAWGGLESTTAWKNNKDTTSIKLINQQARGVNTDSTFKYLNLTKCK